MCGWIKSHRCLLQWEWWSDHNTSRLFIYLLHAANYKPSRWQGKEIEVGQLVTGIHNLCKNTGISPQSIRTSLAKLKSTGEITIKSTNKFSIITICNYEKYQNVENEANNQSNKPTNKRVTNNQQTTNHIQEVKNIRKEEDKNIYTPPTDKKSESKSHDKSGNAKRLLSGSDYVMLSEPQIESIKQKYSDCGLDSHDLKTGIEILEAYAINSPKKFREYVSHYLVLNGWVKENVLKAKRVELDLERSETYLTKAKGVL